MTQSLTFEEASEAWRGAYITHLRMQIAYGLESSKSNAETLEATGIAKMNAQRLFFEAFINRAIAVTAMGQSDRLLIKEFADRLHVLEDIRIFAIEQQLATLKAENKRSAEA